MCKSTIYLHKVACGLVSVFVCHILSVTLQGEEGLVVMGRGQEMFGSGWLGWYPLPPISTPSHINEQYHDKCSEVRNFMFLLGPGNSSSAIIPPVIPHLKNACR